MRILVTRGGRGFRGVSHRHSNMKFGEMIRDAVIAGKSVDDLALPDVSEEVPGSQEDCQQCQRVAAFWERYKEWEKRHQLA